MVFANVDLFWEQTMRLDSCGRCLQGALEFHEHSKELSMD
jgi:hypothetical protein